MLKSLNEDALDSQGLQYSDGANDIEHYNTEQRRNEGHTCSTAMERMMESSRAPPREVEASTEDAERLYSTGTESAAPEQARTTKSVRLREAR